jgi:DNA-binding NarL/FixJ family response regulator
MLSAFNLVILILILLELFFTMLAIVMISKKKFAVSAVKDDHNPKEMLHDPITQNYQKYALTTREVEILELLREGLPYKLIANQLNISTRTVTTHVANMFTKVGVTNKMELVRRILEE